MNVSDSFYQRNEKWIVLLLILLSYPLFFHKLGDRDIWSPDEDVVFVPLEELVELLAHCTVGFAMLFSKEVRKPENPTSAVKKKLTH